MLPVFSDELLTEQIVQNYLSNAFHYVKKGGKIRISASSLMSKDPPSARLSVYNDGDLIPDEALDQIWNKFYKVDKARTRSYGGSGIGLSVVKAAVERLGGSCGVRNLKEGVIELASRDKTLREKVPVSEIHEAIRRYL